MNKKFTGPYKILCFDIDGTLISDEKHITEATKLEVIRVCSKYNIHLILASSRMPLSLDLILNELNQNQPIICYNGALIMGQITTSGDRNVLFSKTISATTASTIVDYALSAALHVGVFRNNDWLVNEMDYWANREVVSTKINPVVTDLNKTLADMKKRSNGLHKIMLRSNSENLNQTQEFLIQNFSTELNIHRVKDTVLEVTPLNVSKATAVKFLCNFLDIKRSQVIAFGDNDNDLEMLKYAGCSIAMGNATKEIKAIATEVTSSNNEDGIALVLKKYFS